MRFQGVRRKEVLRKKLGSDMGTGLTQEEREPN